MPIISEDQPTVSSYFFELNAELNRPSVDLRKLSEIINRNPRLAAQVTGLVNLALLGQRHRATTISEAVLLLGTERLRMLVLAHSLIDFTERYLPPPVARALWRHSFLVALLSEPIASWTGEFENGADDDYLQACLTQLCVEDGAALLETLESELIHPAPILEFPGGNCG